MNGEDAELGYRIRLAGYKVVAIPQARIMHLEGRAWYIKQTRLWFVYEGRYIYFDTVYGKGRAEWLYRLVQGKNPSRIVLFTLLGKKDKVSYWKMKKETNREVFRRFRSRKAGR